MYENMFEGINTLFYGVLWFIWALIGVIVALIVRPDFMWSEWIVAVGGWIFAGMFVGWAIPLVLGIIFERLLD